MGIIAVLLFSQGKLGDTLVPTVMWLEFRAAQSPGN
jgi:hypothetical protein